MYNNNVKIQNLHVQTKGVKFTKAKYSSPKIRELSEVSEFKKLNTIDQNKLIHNLI